MHSRKMKTMRKNSGMVFLGCVPKEFAPASYKMRKCLGSDSETKTDSNTFKMIKLFRSCGKYWKSGFLSIGLHLGPVIKISSAHR